MEVLYGLRLGAQTVLQSGSAAIPRSLAICAMGLPLSRRRRTVSALNSGDTVSCYPTVGHPSLNLSTLAFLIYGVHENRVSSWALVDIDRVTVRQFPTRSLYGSLVVPLVPQLVRTYFAELLVDGSLGVVSVDLFLIHRLRLAAL